MNEAADRAKHSVTYRRAQEPYVRFVTRCVSEAQKRADADASTYNLCDEHGKVVFVVEPSKGVRCAWIEE